MVRRLMFAVATIALVLAAAGCSREDNSIPPVETQDRIIQTATLLDDPSMVVLTWDAVECETFQEVNVDVDPDYANLRIRVLVDIENCPPGGFTQTTVDLGQPLGDRRIYDRAFGDTVALENP